MHSKKHCVSAIDVGTTKVCAIVANGADGGSFQVLGVGVAPSRGLRKGIVVDLDEAREAVKEAVKKAEQASGMKMESAYIGITGSHINSINSRNSIAITRSDRLVQPEDLKRVLESARSINLPKERELLHVIPREYTLDGHEGIKNPVGMHGFRLDADAHVVSADAPSVRNLLKCIRGAGVEAEDIVLSPLASGEAVLSPNEKDAGAIVMDIGSGTTDVAVFKEGNVCYTAVLPIAGYQVSRDIAIGLGIPFDLAERLKIRYGNLCASTNGNSLPPETPISVENGHDVMYQELRDIVRARMEELLGLAQVELPAELATLAPTGVVLSGGTAKLPGIDSLAWEVFGIPARVGVPQRVYGLADVLYDPAYATPVGLLLWGTQAEDVGEVKSHRPRPLHRWLHRFQRRLSKK